MSKAPRPGLDALPFATKKPLSPFAVTNTSTPLEDLPTRVPDPPAPPKSKDDRVTIILRVSAEDRKALKGISVEQDTTIQDMLHAAVQDIIRRSR